MYKYLAVNTFTNKCCLINTSVKVNADNAKSATKFFTYYATNICGRDDIRRTCELMNYRTNGNKYPCNGKYRGIEYEMGESYEFAFYYNEVWEIV